MISDKGKNPPCMRNISATELLVTKWKLEQKYRETILERKLSWWKFRLNLGQVWSGLSESQYDCWICFNRMIVVSPKIELDGSILIILTNFCTLECVALVHKLLKL